MGNFHELAYGNSEILSCVPFVIFFFDCHPKRLKGINGNSVISCGLQHQNISSVSLHQQSNMIIARVRKKSLHPRHDIFALEQNNVESVDDIERIQKSDPLNRKFERID